MANVNTDYLYPEFWAAAFDEIDAGQYQLQQLVSRDVEPLLAEKGASVNVPISPEFSAEDWTPGDSISASTITQQRAQVVLNKSKKVTINLTGAEFSKSAYNLIESYGKPMAQAILESVNTEIYKEALKSTYLVLTGTPVGTIDEDDVIDAGKVLSSNKVTRDGRVLVASPDDIAALLKTDAFQRADASGDGGRAMQLGELGKKFGFQIFENNAIATYTPTDLTGAVNHGGGYSSGATSMVVDGFTDAGTIRAGDIFKTSTGSEYYSITGTTVSTNTVGLTFGCNGSGLDASVADGEGLTITASKSALAFVPSAIALAARAYAVIPVGVMSNVFDLAGIPVRLSIWHDGKLGLSVQADVLFGVKLINEKRVVRIIC